MMEKETDFVNMYSKEAQSKGEERICGRIYNKDICENGDVKIFCYSKNRKLWYTSDENEYNNAIKSSQNQ